MTKPALLSVIIPVYNEKEYVAELVKRVEAVPLDMELILVDDCSTDGTAAIIENEILKKYSNARSLRHDKNQGKGAAIRTGLKAATGELVIIQDADLEYNPQEYLPIVKKFDDASVYVVYGTRFSTVNNYLFVWHWFLNHFFKSDYEIRYLHHFIGIKTLNLLANVLYSAKITDEATCYKAFRRKIFDRITLKCKGFEFCPEVTAKVRKAGYAIVEVPISYHPRSRSQGKKLNWKHGMKAIATLIQYRFTD